MLSKVQQRCLLFVVKTEQIFVRLAETSVFCKKVGKELLLCCARGCLCGAGIGFFLFLRLGFPKDAKLAGYLSGLFVVAGLKFGFSLWLIRGLVFPLAHHLQDSNSSSSKASDRSG